MVCHLNTHSCYSLLEALPSPADLVQAAAERGMSALALTDHRYLTGAIEFYQACRKAGIQPILGLEVDLTWENAARKLILLAESLEGWSNLCRISSAGFLQADADAPLNLEAIEPYSTGLIALSDDQGDPFGKRLRRLAEIFPARLYLSLCDDREQSRLNELALKLDLPAAAIHPVYTLTGNQSALLKTLAAIRLNTTLSRLPPGSTAPEGASFISPLEMQGRFKDFPAALAATSEIASRCAFELPLGRANFPEVPLPPGLTAAQYLRQKAEEGAAHLYNHITPEIRSRLDHELEVIANRGFEPIFLIVEELLAFARRQGIPFSSRGSAASSLVAHCIGITSPDPLRLNLYFERFLNPARTTPPDIDTDLCSRRRDEVIQHVFEVYGDEKVAMVGTINRFRPRSALGDVAKAHGLPPEQARELTATLPYGFFARRDENDEEEDHPSPFADLIRSNLSPKMRPVFADAEALLKLPRHLSVHAGGLVVSPGVMTDLVPVMRSGSKGIIITQLDLDSVEALGLIKIDLLGIRGLTVLGDVADAIHSWQRREYPTPLTVLDKIPEDDDATSDRIERGETIGCFQIESPGMRATLREIQARTPDDLIAALALYRPGPITGGMKDSFVRRFKGEEPVSYLHPSLEPLLAETHGVILYQEQVLRIGNQLAGFSLADADLLRRAMSHFDPGRQMQALKEKFIKAAEEKSGVPNEIGARIWELMAAFAGYGFPKAHAASYAQVAWRGAWCKTHFPAEFMSAVLANWGGYYSQRVYLSEARRLGLKVNPPHVNHSKREFSVAYPGGQPVMYMGLDQVKDLTNRAMERIINLRPFATLEDFLSRVDPRRAEGENLVKAGALEGFGPAPALLRRIQGGEWQPGQMSLFESAIESDEDWSLAQKVAAQQEVLGISVSAHPLELHAEKIKRSGAISTVEAAGLAGKRVTIAGLRQSSHRSHTAKGESMLFLTLEDLEGMLEAVVFPDVYRRVKEFIYSPQPLLVTGMVETDAVRGEPILQVEKISLIV